ncbi:MAG TPA: RecX family transcriptional regulator [Candidatus Fournierella excrementigallinarum]|nr:RecX family transcriptional regulator [Candidatus Fournierella excrementigallinarum]
METTITRISRTRKGRFALFCEAGFLFSVDEETFSTGHLAEGMTLDDGQLEEFVRKSDAQRAKDKAFAYLAAREHASGELFQKLCRDFDEHTAAAAVAKMDELGLLNDGAFARRAAAWLLSKSKSRSEILRWMAARGVDRDLARQALEEAYEECQADAPEGLGPDGAAALRLVEKQYAAKLAAGKKQNVLAALARRGFSSGDARRAVELWLEEHPADGEL